MLYTCGSDRSKKMSKLSQNQFSGLKRLHFGCINSRTNEFRSRRSLCSLLHWMMKSPSLPSSIVRFSVRLTLIRISCAHRAIALPSGEQNQRWSAPRKYVHTRKSLQRDSQARLVWIIPRSCTSCAKWIFKFWWLANDMWHTWNLSDLNAFRPEKRKKYEKHKGQAGRWGTLCAHVSTKFAERTIRSGYETE